MNIEKVTTVVRVEGRCPKAHLVFYDLPVTAVKGSRGLATAKVECPKGCGVANLSAPFRA